MCQLWFRLPRLGLLLLLRRRHVGWHLMGMRVGDVRMRELVVRVRLGLVMGIVLSVGLLGLTEVVEVRRPRHAHVGL